MRLGGQRRVEQLQFSAQCLDVLDRLATASARDVDDVNEHLRALEMPEELMSEAKPAVRALNQPGHIGDDEASLVAQTDDAEVRRQRRERVVRYLRARRRNARDERGLAGVGESNQTYVGQQPELEPQILLFAFSAWFDAARRTVR